MALSFPGNQIVRVEGYSREDYFVIVCVLCGDGVMQFARRMHHASTRGIAFVR